MLTEDALQLLIETAERAAAPKLLDVNDRLKAIFMPGFENKFVPTPPNPLCRELDTFDAFLSYVLERKEHVQKGAVAAIDKHDEIANEGSVVFLSDKGFTYAEQPGLRAGLTARYKLIESEPFIWLKGESAKWHDQPSFIKALQFKLRRELPPSNLTALIREVKFTSNAQGSGVVQHGKQSMSREIIHEVKGTGVIPEDVTLRIQPFENLAYTANVVCAIGIDEKTCSFQLQPFPGEMRRAVDGVILSAQKELQDAGISSFQGKP